MSRKTWTLAEIQEIADDIKADPATTAKASEGLDFFIDILGMAEAKNLPINAESLKSILAQYTGPRESHAAKPS